MVNESSATSNILKTEFGFLRFTNGKDVQCVHPSRHDRLSTWNDICDMLSYVYPAFTRRFSKNSNSERSKAKASRIQTFSPRCFFPLNKRFSKASKSIYLFNKRASWCQKQASQHFEKLVTPRWQIPLGGRVLQRQHHHVRRLGRQDLPGPPRRPQLPGLRVRLQRLLHAGLCQVRPWENGGWQYCRGGILRDRQASPVVVGIYRCLQPTTARPMLVCSSVAVATVTRKLVLEDRSSVGRALKIPPLAASSFMADDLRVRKINLLNKNKSYIPLRDYGFCDKIVPKNNLKHSLVIQLWRGSVLRFGFWNNSTMFLSLFWIVSSPRTA